MLDSRCKWKFGRSSVALNMDKEIGMFQTKPSFKPWEIVGSERAESRCQSCFPQRNLGLKMLSETALFPPLASTKSQQTYPHTNYSILARKNERTNGRSQNMPKLCRETLKMNMSFELVGVSWRLGWPSQDNLSVVDTAFHFTQRLPYNLQDYLAQGYHYQAGCQVQIWGFLHD